MRVWFEKHDQLTGFVQEVDVGGAVPLLPVGGDHLVLVPEVFDEVARLEPGVRREPQLFDPVLGRVVGFSVGHFGEGKVGPSLRFKSEPLQWIDGTCHGKHPKYEAKRRRQRERDRRDVHCWVDRRFSTAPTLSSCVTGSAGRFLASRVILLLNSYRISIVSKFRGQNFAKFYVSGFARQLFSPSCTCRMWRLLNNFAETKSVKMNFPIHNTPSQTSNIILIMIRTAELEMHIAQIRQRHSKCSINLGE